MWFTSTTRQTPRREKCWQKQWFGPFSAETERTIFMWLATKTIPNRKSSKLWMKNSSRPLRSGLASKCLALFIRSQNPIKCPFSSTHGRESSPARCIRGTKILTFAKFPLTVLPFLICGPCWTFKWNQGKSQLIMPTFQRSFGALLSKKSLPPTFLIWFHVCCAMSWKWVGCKLISDDTSPLKVLFNFLWQSRRNFSLCIYVLFLFFFRNTLRH